MGDRVVDVTAEDDVRALISEIRSEWKTNEVVLEVGNYYSFLTLFKWEKSGNRDIV